MADMTLAVKVALNLNTTNELESLGEKTYVCSRSQISCPISTKLGQNVCLNNLLDEFEYWSF